MVLLVSAFWGFWGFWVIADSAQFSAMVTEKADPRYVGSAVALQLAIGYVTALYVSRKSLKHVRFLPAC